MPVLACGSCASAEESRQRTAGDRAARRPGDDLMQIEVFTVTRQRGNTASVTVRGCLAVSGLLRFAKAEQGWTLNGSNATIIQLCEI